MVLGESEAQKEIEKHEKEVLNLRMQQEKHNLLTELLSRQEYMGAFQSTVGDL
jgi:hypothetical protein